LKASVSIFGQLALLRQIQTTFFSFASMENQSFSQFEVLMLDMVYSIDLHFYSDVFKVFSRVLLFHWFVFASSKKKIGIKPIKISTQNQHLIYSTVKTTKTDCIFSSNDVIFKLSKSKEFIVFTFRIM